MGKISSIGLGQNRVGNKKYWFAAGLVVASDWGKMGGVMAHLRGGVMAHLHGGVMALLHGGEQVYNIQAVPSIRFFLVRCLPVLRHSVGLSLRLCAYRIGLP
jgi:hypothetical protein